MTFFPSLLLGREDGPVLRDEKAVGRGDGAVPWGERAFSGTKNVLWKRYPAVYQGDPVKSFLKNLLVRVGSVLALALLYPLSVGPVAFYLSGHPSARNVELATRVYAPLFDVPGMREYAQFWAGLNWRPIRKVQPEEG